MSLIDEFDYPLQEQPVIRIKSLGFAYPDGEFHIRVPQLDVAASEKLAITGPAGSGKTTLLNLLAGILTPTEGGITVDRESLASQGESARRHLRITTIGLVSQDLALLDYLSVMDNILLPYRLSRVLTLDSGVRTRAEALAKGMGLGPKLARSTLDLCYGEKRCIGICRALLPKPRLILADDPMAGLDPQGRSHVLSLMMRSAEVYGATVVASTHDHELLDRFDRAVDCSEFGSGGSE